MSAKLRANVGDLVVCKYDFEYIYYPSYPPHPSDLFYIGIVVRERKQSAIFFDRDMVYEVICVDGVTRFFAPWEVEVIREARSP